MTVIVEQQLQAARHGGANVGQVPAWWSIAALICTLRRNSSIRETYEQLCIPHCDVQVWCEYRTSLPFP